MNRRPCQGGNAEEVQGRCVIEGELDLLDLIVEYATDPPSSSMFGSHYLSHLWLILYTIVYDEELASDEAILQWMSNVREKLSWHSGSQQCVEQPLREAICHPKMQEFMRMWLNK
jgi:hypothetical protein